MSAQSFAPETLTLEALRANGAPDFIERNTEALKAIYIAKFEELTERTLYPAQTEMFVLEVMAYAKSVMGEAIQAAFLQNRAIWAEKQHLDEVGANVSTFRLQAQTAISRVRFTLTEARPTSVVVPVGTRVSAGTDFIFSTVDDLIIPAGDLTGVVNVVAERSGAEFNDFASGQISDILDPIPYVTTVENVITSGGGSDVEDDDRYRLRIVNAFERISKAGPREGYIELVKAVHPNIIDVAVIRPQPGYIEITPLMFFAGEGEATDDALDTAIIDFLDPETRIPMGDFPSIVRAGNQIFDITLNVRISGAISGLQSQIEEAVRKVFLRPKLNPDGDVVGHEGWSVELGAQVSPSAILGAVNAIPGVIDVEGPGFAYTDLGATEFATIGQLTINLIEAPNV